MNKVSETGRTIKFVIANDKYDDKKYPNPFNGVEFINCSDLKEDECIIVYDKE